MKNDNYWARAAARRYSRRGVLGTATAAAGMIAVGCGGDDDTGSSNGVGDAQPTNTLAPNTTAVAGISDYPSYTSVAKAADYIQKYNWRNLPKPIGAPRKGGNFTHAVGLIPPHFDPFGPLVNGYPIPTNLRQIYNQLTRLKMEYDADLDKADPQGELAESWEQPDNTTLTFKLRNGVKFQDIAPVNGRVLTSADVKYSYENYMKTPISGYFENVSAINAIDANTVQLKFSKPTAYFLNVISGPSTSILPTELDEQNRRTNPVGTGPFQLKGGEYKPDQIVKYVRNPTYWESRNNIQLPYLDSVTTVFPADATVALEGFRNGQYDSSAYVNTFNLVDSVLGTNKDTIIQVVSDHPSVIYYLGLNNAVAKWKDERVRQAVAYAVDTQQIIDLALEGSATPGCLVDWASMGFKAPPQLKEMAAPLQKQDIAKAKELLKAAGQENLTISVLFTSTDTRGQAIFSILQQQLKDAGITLTADTKDATSVANALYNKQTPDAILTTQLPSGPDADVFTYQFMHSKGPSNWFNISDPKMDELSLKQREILDVTQRQAAVKDVWNYAQEKMFLVPLASPAFIRARQPYLMNWQNHRYLDPLGWGAHIHGLMWFADNAPANKKG